MIMLDKITEYAVFFCDGIFLRYVTMVRYYEGWREID